MSNLTGITDKILNKKDTFKVALKLFLKILKEQIVFTLLAMI